MILLCLFSFSSILSIILSFLFGEPKDSLTRASLLISISFPCVERIWSQGVSCVYWGPLYKFENDYTNGENLSNFTGSGRLSSGSSWFEDTDVLF